MRTANSLRIRNIPDMCVEHLFFEFRKVNELVSNMIQVITNVVRLYLLEYLHGRRARGTLCQVLTAYLRSDIGKCSVPCKGYKGYLTF